LPSTPSNSYERVKEFHETFGHPVGDKPEIPSDDRQELRLSLIFEEAIELAEAMGFNPQWVKSQVEIMLYHDGPVEKETDLIAVADALGDLDYVVNGAALEFGIDLPKVTAEVHRSNMTKLGPDGKPIYREDGKVLKGEGYEPPNLKKVLFS
jgi:predicted HAD superfamily Cof-like phosphohydrolase